MSTYYLKVGDTGQVITDTLLDENGDAINLNGASVRFIARRRGASGVPHIAGNCTVTGVTAGEVSYSPDPADTAPGTDGVYDQEWQITFNSGAIVSVPNEGYNTLRITEQLGS